MKNLIYSTLFLSLTASLLSASSLVQVSFTTLPGQIADGEYVGYSNASVTGTVLGNTLNDANLQVICDDLLHNTAVPSGPFGYIASDFLNPLSPASTDLSSVRFQNSSEVTNYEVAAILLWEYNGLSMANQASLAGDYNFALWKLFDPSADTVGTSGTLLSAAETQQTLGATVNQDAYKHFVVLTPNVDAASNQEFLTEIASPVRTPTVPEPVTLILSGVGLIGIGFRKVRRTV